MIALENVMQKRTAVNVQTSGREVVYKLLATGLSGMPVVDDEWSVVGIVSELDVLNALNNGRKADELTAGDVMSKDPKTVDMDTSVQEIVTLMVTNKFTMIPVLKNGKLAGIVSRQSVLEAWLEPENYSRYNR